MILVLEKIEVKVLLCLSRGAIHVLVCMYKYIQGFFQLFAQGGGGGQNEIVWITGGASMYPCAKHVAN